MSATERVFGDVFWDDGSPEKFPHYRAWVDDAVDHLARTGTCREGDSATFYRERDLLFLEARGDGLERGMTYRVTLSVGYEDEAGRPALTVLAVDPIARRR